MFSSPAHQRQQGEIEATPPRTGRAAYAGAASRHLRRDVAAERARTCHRASADAAERQLEAARRQQRSVDLGSKANGCPATRRGHRRHAGGTEVVQMRAQLQDSRNNSRTCCMCCQVRNLSGNSAVIVAGAGREISARCASLCCTMAPSPSPPRRSRTHRRTATGGRHTQSAAKAPERIEAWCAR